MGRMVSAVFDVSCYVDTKGNDTTRTSTCEVICLKQVKFKNPGNNNEDDGIVRKLQYGDLRWSDG